MTGTPSRADSHNVRFGVMTNGAQLRIWEYECLRKLLAQPGVELATVIVNGNPPSAGPHRSLLARARSKHLLFRLYRDHWFQPSAMNYIDVGATLAGVPLMRCTVTEKGPSHYFEDSDVEAIRRYDLDFILRFGFNILRGGILEAARYGVWSFHHGDERKYRGHPACFWEIYSGDPVTGAVLQRLTERLDGGVVLRKGFFRTVPWSHTLSRNEVLLGAVDWPAEVCADIQRGRTHYLSGLPSPTTAPIYRAPTNRQMIRFAIRVVTNRAAMHVTRRVRLEEWNIGLVRRPITSFLTNPALEDVEWYDGASRGSLADPFGIDMNGKSTVLCERFAGGLDHGVIESLQVGRHGWEADRHRLPLAATGHSSYPFLLVHDGDVYCVPETRGAGQIALYRADPFPDRWIKLATLIDGVEGVDPTLFRHGGRWWLLFTNWRQNSTLRLFAYYAPSLSGPWQPHAGNPIKTDIRSARPAGTPFTHEGCLYRPAQDCSRSYGYRVVICHVLCLTPDEFVEEPAAVVGPQRGPYPHGVHTLSALGDLTLVDGKRHVYRLGPWSWTGRS